MPKILKLSPYYYPEVISSSHLTEDLTAALVNAGFDILNYVPTPTRGVSQEVRNRYAKMRFEETNDGHVVIHRFPMFREGRNPILRALRYVLVNTIQYFKGSSAKDIDFIYSGSTPPTQGLLCSLVKRRLNAPYIFVLQDVFPDSLVNADLTRKGSLIWKLGRKIEDFTYRNADAIVAVSEGIKRNIMAKGVPEDKITVIWNWIDTDAVRPIDAEDNPLYDELGLERKKKYVVYAGNIGFAQNVGILVDAAEKLSSFSDDLEFLIFGSGVLEDEIRARIRESGLANIRLFPLRPVEEAGLVYSLGIASVVACKKGFGTSAMPSKTWTIMATGTPVLCSYDAGSDMELVVRDGEAGLFSEAENIDDFCENILKLLSDSSLCTRLGANARDYVKRNASKTICTAKYIEVFQHAIDKESCYRDEEA